MSEFLTIRNFNQEAQYLELLHVLESHNIPYQTEAYRQRLDPISMVTLAPEYIVKVQSHDFAKVSELMNELAELAVLDASDEHYLFDFKDEELFDILASPDEWSAFDYQLARRILDERGIEIDTKLLNSLKESRLQELAQPEEKPTSLLSAYFFALLGGVIGIVLGWHIMTARKTLPDGQRPYLYPESDRKHGPWIIALGVVMLVVWLLFKPFGVGIF